MPFNMYGKANASLAITHGVNILMIKVKRPFFEKYKTSCAKVFQKYSSMFEGLIMKTLEH
jgi:hypothetical protein